MYPEILRIRKPGMRTRIHGDLHLAQVLYTGEDVVFIDFEGDNSRPLAERVLKRSPLVDVASMLISLRYAVEQAGATRARESKAMRRNRNELEAWTQVWYAAAAGAYLNQYRATAGDHPMIPQEEHDLRNMLHIQLVAKAVYDVGYEIENRPAWIAVALSSLLYVWGGVHGGEFLPAV